MIYSYLLSYKGFNGFAMFADEMNIFQSELKKFGTNGSEGNLYDVDGLSINVSEEPLAHCLNPKTLEMAGELDLSVHAECKLMLALMCASLNAFKLSAGTYRPGENNLVLSVCDNKDMNNVNMEDVNLRHSFIQSWGFPDLVQQAKDLGVLPKIVSLADLNGVVPSLYF